MSGGGGWLRSLWWGEGGGGGDPGGVEGEEDALDESEGVGGVVGKDWGEAGDTNKQRERAGPGEGAQESERGHGAGERDGGDGEGEESDQGGGGVDEAGGGGGLVPLAVGIRRKLGAEEAGGGPEGEQVKGPAAGAGRVVGAEGGEQGDGAEGEQREGDAEEPAVGAVQVIADGDLDGVEVGLEEVDEDGEGEEGGDAGEGEALGGQLGETQAGGDLFRGAAGDGAAAGYMGGSSSEMSSTRFSNFVYSWRKTRGILPMGPLRCLAMMTSARPLRSSRSRL